MARLSALLLLAVLVPALAQGQARSTKDIRKEMARIRATTDWEDPRAAAAANSKIEELSRQIMKGARPEQFDEAGKAKAGSQADLLEMAGKSVEQGDGAPIDLAKSVREEMEKERKEDEDPTIRSAAFLEELDTLIVNLSDPEGRATADQIGKFRKVRTLVIVGGGEAGSYDLDALLARGAHLPLQHLAILGFGGALRSVPPGVARFASLERLSVLNGAITALSATPGPPSLGVLHLDGNPITSLASSLRSVRGLKELGLRRTKISAAELAEIRKLLPACKVDGP